VITTGAGSRFSSRLCGSSAHSSRTRPTSRRSSRRPSRARLAITDPDCLARYAKREQTHREHAGEIQHVYGYRDFSERTARTELSVWLDARAWTTAERPQRAVRSRDRSPDRCQGALPGASVLARLIAAARDRATERLYATLAGALGRYLDAKGERTAGVTIRAAAPVNLRSGDGSSFELGNHFGLAFVDLPIGIRHPLQRLYAVHTTMQALKGSPEALVTFGLLSLVGSLPTAVEEPAIAWFSAKASLVASNVRGPSRPLHLAGAQVSQLLFWVPQTGGIGVGISMFTYKEEVQVSVIADRGLVPEPSELVSIIHTEFDRLVLLVLLGGGAIVD